MSSALQTAVKISPALIATGRRGRQRRLVEWMQAQDVELAIVTRAEQVQWLTGARFSALAAPAAALRADGRCLLVCPGEPPEGVAVDELATYEGQWLCTWRNDQGQSAAAALLKAIGVQPPSRRVGIEFSNCGPHVRALAGEVVDIEPVLYSLRRRKDPDELALVRWAIAGVGAMYRRARRIVRPGVNELHVYCELHAAAVQELGEPPTGLGNDFQCGSPGGPPRDRAAEAGELYILDLGLGFRGYYADTCRTIAVGGQPTGEQARAWEQLMQVFPLVERTVKPGVSCKALYQEVKGKLDLHLPGGFFHHLGHGIGLAPHEGPHINPHWNDTFEVGDLFTIEPGLYGPSLRAGIRLEDDYLVTETGVERLTDFPLEL